MPVVVRERRSDKEMLEVALVENLQREDLNPLEAAAAYARLKEEFHLTQEDVARRVGKDRATVANALRILKLRPSVREKIREGSLSAGHAKALAALSSADDQERLAEEILRRALSVRQTEKRVASFGSGGEGRPGEAGGSLHPRRGGEALAAIEEPRPDRPPPPRGEDRDRVRFGRRVDRPLREAFREELIGREEMDQMVERSEDQTMGGSMKLRGEGSTLNGFIDKGSHVRGDLAFEDTFRIDGKFEGKIRSGSELILGDTAEVTAEIDVGRLSVNGSLKGSVRATERVELLARSRESSRDIATPILRDRGGGGFPWRLPDGGGGELQSGRAPLPTARQHVTIENKET